MNLGFWKGHGKGLSLGLGALANQGPAGGDPIGDALRADAVAYWNMDETGGARVDSKASYNLSVFDADDLGRDVSSVAGKIGNAAYLNLSDKPVILRLADNAAFRATNSQIMYYAIWAKIPSGNIGDRTIIGKTQADPYYYDTFLVIGNPTPSTDPFTEIRLAYGGDPWPVFTKSSVSIPYDTWVLVEHYLDSASNEAGIALNGGAFSTGALGQTLVGGTGFLSFGAEGGDLGVGVTGRDIYIDETLVMHRVPTSAERAYLYNSGAGRTLYP